ncbi:MAG: hypothetical protein HN704_08625 [Bacteroidetes bacterium]|jgi:hypothetical protein|nr:hypothetical protein [Bacteroidota bacterium]MBT6685911.1 hypothetical protein [Bacteroidota bacterium]MBT7143130.1 hypothetical protein [Bacteroidota bacterium]MBT7491656.1 hypothetical protein [Bacteroidota bacterium]
MENLESKKRCNITFKKVIKTTGLVLLGIVGASAFALAIGYGVMLLWNWLLPDLFGFIEITFWQAVAIVVLARLIFGGFKHPHKGSHHDTFMSRFHNNKCEPAKSKNYDKWEHYDEFWKTEGEKAFMDFVERKN